MNISESNTKKKTDQDAHTWFRHPKSQGEKRKYGAAKDQDVKVRGKRSPKNLGDLYDDKSIPFKKQNSKKKPSKETIRKGEEDEQSIGKQMRKEGKATFKGPNVKERKPFAPPTQTHKSAKAYDRKKSKNAFEEDEEKSCWKGYEKKGMKKKGKKTVPNCVKESTAIADFISALMTGDQAQAHKHLKDALNAKIAKRIASEIDTPIF